jgi:hypothetical protein
MCVCTPNKRTPYCGAPGCEWPKKKKILTNCYRFENGMVMAFDQNSEQMPEYQGRFEDVRHKIIRDFPDITIQGAIWRNQR